MPDITPAERAELRRLHEAATPGEWTVNPHYPHADDYAGSYDSDGNLQCSHSRYVESPTGTVCTTGRDTRNVELIAAARNFLPALLDAADERDALRARLAEVTRDRDAHREIVDMLLAMDARATHRSAEAIAYDVECLKSLVKVRRYALAGR